jgi:hypothetical protein
VVFVGLAGVQDLGVVQQLVYVGSTQAAIEPSLQPDAHLRDRRPSVLLAGELRHDAHKDEHDQTKTDRSSDDALDPGATC